MSDVLRSIRQAPEVPGAKIVYCLKDLFFAVHDEGSPPYQWLIDGLTGQPQQRNVALRVKLHSASLAVQVHQLAITDRRAIDQQPTLQHYQCQSKALPGGQLHSSALRQTQIQHVHRRKGPSRALSTAEFTGNDPELSCSLRQIHHRDTG